MATPKENNTTRAGTNAKRIGDVLPDTGWPDLPQRKFEDLAEIGEDITVLDCVFRRSPKFPKAGQFAVIKCVDSDGEEFTTAGGQVVTDKVRTLKENGDFPVVARPVKVTGGDFGSYWDLI